jgi:hypothetical protein
MRNISCGVFVRLPILVSRTKRTHELLSGLGKVKTSVRGDDGPADR